MLKIPATLPGIGDVYVVWFLVSLTDIRAVYVTRGGRLGVGRLDDFRDVRLEFEDLPQSDGLLLIGAEEA